MMLLKKNLLQKKLLQKKLHLKHMKVLGRKFIMWLIKLKKLCI